MDWLEEILKDKGVENAEEIAGAIQKELPKQFIPKTEYNKKNEEAKKLQKLVDEAPDVDALRKAMDELQAKYDADCGKLANDLAGAKRGYAIDLAVEKSGARNAKAVKALLDDEKITMDDKGVHGLEEEIERVKSENDYLFGSGKATAAPIGGSGGADDDKFAAALRKGAGLT